MARYYDDDNDYYDDDEQFDFGSLSITEQQYQLYEFIGFSSAGSDYALHDQFWDVWYNNELDIETRQALEQEMADYIWDEYGIDYFEVWDWDDFRAWYDAA